MWEQPPLLSAHSFRPAERGAEGGSTEGGIGTGGEGIKEELNIDEITSDRYKGIVGQKNESPHKVERFVCVNIFNHSAS